MPERTERALNEGSILMMCIHRMHVRTCRAHFRNVLCQPYCAHAYTDGARANVLRIPSNKQILHVVPDCIIILRLSYAGYFSKAYVSYILFLFPKLLNFSCIPSFETLILYQSLLV